MTTTTNLNISLVQTAQAQKEVTVNEAISVLDAISNTGAISKDFTAPPGSPSEGDVYIVAASATGDWSGEDGNIAYFNQIWKFITPNEGMRLWLNDENRIYAYDGSSWGVAATNNIGKQTLYIPASQMTPASSSGCAALATSALGANMPDIHYLAFDASTAEYAHISIPMPARWNAGGGIITLGLK